MTLPIPLLWRYHARSLASAGLWPVRAALITPVVVAALAIVINAGDPDASLRFFSDGLLPLLGSLTVALALWPEMSSGALKSWAVSPDRAGFRWLLQRSALALGGMAVLILAGMFLGTLLDLLLGIMPQPWVDPGFFIGYLFSAALTLAGTLFFRHPLGGVALAVAYWLLDLRLGVVGNPLLTLHGTSARLDGQVSLLASLFNKPALLAGTVGLLGWCSYAAPRLVQPANKREQARHAGILVGGLFTVLLVQSVLTVGFLYASRKPANPVERKVQPSTGVQTVTWPTMRNTNLAAVGAPMKTFSPLPLSLLFGPVYHGLVTLPPIKGADVSMPPAGVPASSLDASLENSRARIEALSKLVRDYGSWPWADTAAYELAVTRFAVDGVSGLHDYWNLVERYPNSPYAADSLAFIMNMPQVDVLVERLPNSSLGGVPNGAPLPPTLSGARRLAKLFPKSDKGLDRSRHSIPLQPRLSAALLLVERYPNSRQAVAAREMVLSYYPALIRPDAVAPAAKKAVEVTSGAERAQWLAVLAETDVNFGRYEDADKKLKLAREAESRGGGSDFEPTAGGSRLDRLQQMLEVWRNQKQGGGP